MRQIKADLSRLDEIIARQYEDKVRGFAKDSMQNSWEARLNRKKGTGFSMDYRLFKQLDGYSNVLMFEDDGTHGMNDDRWDAFHAHWQTTKGGSYQGGIGRWGQGKTLYLHMSGSNRILTESKDVESGKYRFSMRTNTCWVQQGDAPDPQNPKWMTKKGGEVKSIKDFFPSQEQLKHAGTRIWLLEVREELVEQIEKGELIRYLSESWWEVIRNCQIRILCGVNENLREVNLPIVPQSRDKVVHEHVEFDTRYGQVRKLKLVLAKDPVPESLRGVAIQRGGMTVCRYPIPSSAPEDLRERVYGYCMMDRNLDEQMWEIEMANHEGFEVRKSVWVGLRRMIDAKAEEFIAAHISRKKAERVSVDVEQIISTVNKLVDEHLEGLGTGRKRIRTDPPPPTPRKPIRLSPWGYIGDNRRFDPGDLMSIKCGIVNDSTSSDTYSVQAWVEDNTGATYWNAEEHGIRLAARNRASVSLPEIELSSASLKKGAYRLRGKLIDSSKACIHERSAVFYYEMEPPAALGGWLKRIILAPLGGPSRMLRNVPINPDGELLVNQDHVEMRKVIESTNLTKKQKAKRLVDTIINVALHEATREIALNWWQDEKVEYDMQHIKRPKDLFDQMWADYLTDRNQ